MHRCFVNTSFNIGETISITGDEASHIQRVLRLNSGDDIELLNGSGLVASATLTEVSKQGVFAEIKNVFESDSEPKVKVVLFQGIAKEAKMDFIIQKATELGISEIVPVETCFSVVKIKDIAKKVERWQKIATDAAKQCKRATIPLIKEPVKFEKALELLKENEIFFMPYECEEDGSLKKLIENKKVKSLGYIIGPEGGFSEKEASLAKEKGIPIVTLGKRILRTETAAIATLSILMFGFGEI